jgi:CrcB protein
MISKLLAVGAGGALGAMARYLIHLFWVSRVEFPLGTLSANVLGCLAIGAVMSILEHRHWPGEYVRLLIVTGLLGSLTTFSTFGFESFELARQGKMGWAVGNVVFNLAVGLASVWFGWVVVARLSGP